MRCFIALELSQKSRDEFSRITGILKASGVAVKWIAPKKIHLTLKFLGDVPKNKISAVTDKLKNIAAATPSFCITPESIGAFPGWSRPKAVWVGVGPGGDAVKDLAARIENAMKKEGFKKRDKPFSPHFTLGRIKIAKKTFLLKKTANAITVTPVPVRISEVVLFKSDLTPTGAVYTPLSRHRLKA
ncbi:MAG: RNA 2',3'-cyclic phosphodiesterase [Candidatus Omnitrophota bacterium]